MKRPAFQFYPADWRKDTGLQSCSIAARGLWHELLCIMHENVPYGHLTLNGVVLSDEKAARACGVELKLYRKLLQELEEAGVPSRTQEGILISRRMVKDERLREIRAACGQLGGNPELLKNSLSKTQVLDKPPDKVQPTPSSSSSSKPMVEETPTVASPVNGKTHGTIAPEKQGKPTKWHSTDTGVEAEAKRMGIKPLPGENHYALKQRIFAAKAKQERKPA